MVIYGHLVIGLMIMWMATTGYREYGYFHHNQDSYGHPVTGDLKVDCMDGIPATGDHMLAFMAVLTMVMVMADLVLEVEDGKVTLSDTIELL
jgi:hypothetical protein